MFSFPDLEAFCGSKSVSNCWFLTFMWISQEAGQVFWYSHLCKNFSQFVVMHTVKGFSVINKAEWMFFLELSCFSYDPTYVGNLISWSSAFSRSSMNIWNFPVHILLKFGLENFENYFGRVWDECNRAVVCTFFGISHLWDWNENLLFQSCGHCWVFQMFWLIEWSTLRVSPFRIRNSCTGIL